MPRKMFKVVGFIEVSTADEEAIEELKALILGELDGADYDADYDDGEREITGTLDVQAVDII